jgi:hypothetical protein
VKQKHAVSIDTVEMRSSPASPGDVVQISTSVVNIGSNDEKVQVSVKSDLGVSVSSAVFALKEGDSSTQHLTFSIPEDASEQKYFVVVTATYGSLSTSKTLVLEVLENAGAGSVVSVVDGTTAAGTGTSGEPEGAVPVALALVAIVLAALIIWLAKDFFVQKPVTAKTAVAARRGK